MKNSSITDSANRTRQSNIVETDCKICGAPAKYFYFGVISCNPCKMFFKRTAERGKGTFSCSYDGHCRINITNRHMCSYCRLVKCFESGMKVELIRPSYAKRDRKNRKLKIKAISNQTVSTALCRLNNYKQLSTLNLIRTDQSTLTDEQWNLLSNLSNCYDEYNGLSIGTRYILEQSILPLKLRFKHGPLIDFIQNILHQCRSIYINNQGFLSLSRHDRSTLLNISFKYTAGLAMNYIGYRIHLFDNPVYFNMLRMTTHLSLLPIAKRIAVRLGFDMIIMKLFLAIVSFSTTRYTAYPTSFTENLSNIKQILQIQNAYIEVTWRYLIYKYSFERAVICLSDLIRCSFVIEEAIVKTHDVQWFSDVVSSIVNHIERTLTIN